MTFDPNSHHRRSIRLRGYDYTSSGAYFVTVCTRNRACILEDPMLRQMITETWQGLPQRFAGVALDEFVIMPNHVHFIIWVRPVPEPVGAPLAGAPAPLAGAPAPLAGAPAPLAGAPGPGVGAGASPAPTVGDVVGSFKSLVAMAYLEWVKHHAPDRSARLWQRNYYERVVRDERELAQLREYVRNNPGRWEEDTDNLQRAKGTGRPGLSAQATSPRDATPQKLVVRGVPQPQDC